jgi:hypothetical protein
MSYLRGLVRKTRAPRPQIAPRAAPPAVQPAFDIAEVHEEVVTARRPAASAPDVPVAPLVRAAPSVAETTARDPAPKSARAVLHDDMPAAARGHTPNERIEEVTAAPAGVAAPRAPSEALPAAQDIVSRRTQTIRRHVADPVSPGGSVERVAQAAPAADIDGDPLVPVRASQPVARELAPWRRPRPPATAPPPRDRDPPPPEVHISIGRLEVRASVAVPAKPERPAPFRPALTLQDYLAGRSRGQ